MTEPIVHITPITFEAHRETPLTRPPTPPKHGPRVVCLNCNIENELQPGLPLCARCGEPLLDSHVVDMTPKRLRQHLEGNDFPVAILYWSASRYETYGMNDDFAEAADYLHRMVRFGRVDVDAYPDLAQKMNATHAPQLVLYHRRSEVARWGTPLFMPAMVGWIRAHAGAVPDLGQFS